MAIVESKVELLLFDLIQFNSSSPELKIGVECTTILLHERLLLPFLALNFEQRFDKMRWDEIRLRFREKICFNAYILK